MKHVEAIVLSMTTEERKKPDIMNGSRRARVAKGAGRPISEVNRLLEQFREMQKMMKKSANLPGGGGKFPPEYVWRDRAATATTVRAKASRSSVSRGSSPWSVARTRTSSPAPVIIVASCTRRARGSKSGSGPQREGDAVVGQFGAHRLDLGQGVGQVDADPGQPVIAGWVVQGEGQRRVLGGVQHRPQRIGAVPEPVDHRPDRPVPICRHRDHLHRLPSARHDAVTP